MVQIQPRHIICYISGPISENFSTNHPRQKYQNANKNTKEILFIRFRIHEIPQLIRSIKKLLRYIFYLSLYDALFTGHSNFMFVLQICQQKPGNISTGSVWLGLTAQTRSLHSDGISWWVTLRLYWIDNNNSFDDLRWWKILNNKCTFLNTIWAQPILKSRSYVC